MPAGSVIALLLAGYLAFLALIGWLAERRPLLSARPRLRSAFYGLSLATLCSAWTYFGAVGETSTGSWLFLANALGPVIAVTLGYPVWRRIAVLSKQENVGSLADFLAARYGKSRLLGTLVTVVAALGALPYVALQVSILVQVWKALGGKTGPDEAAALGLVAVLCLFAILFGARRPSLTQHNRGFVTIIAAESVVKLVGLLGVAGLSLTLVLESGGAGALIAAIPPPLPALNGSFVTLTLLCTLTAFTLPRQFHLGFVTLERPADARAAIWIVPAYFLTWAAATLVIAAAIRSGLGHAGMAAHLQVMGIPLAHGPRWIALLALLGGFSSGAAMVIVETTAISAMVSNEIVLPLLSHYSSHYGAGRWPRWNAGQMILRVRRGTILLIGALAWAYFLATRELATPTQLGAMALAAFAQLMPALIGGIYWRRGHAHGAIAGICAGMAVWLLALAAPALLGSGTRLSAALLLWPRGETPLGDVAVIFSLLLNIGLYVAVSLRVRPRLVDTIQANSFVLSPRGAEGDGARRIAATMGDLHRLLAQFLGDGAARRALLERTTGPRPELWADERPAGPEAIRAAERALAGVIGASSARNMIAIALAEESQDAAEISQILDEAGHAVHFSRELLQTTLDTLPQGVSVIDPALRLIAWNARCLALLGVPLEQVHVGRPLDDLLAALPADRAVDPLRQRIIAEAGRFALRRPVDREVALADGRTLGLSGRPLGEEDYLVTIADITDLKQAEQILAQSNELLEARVTARTRELSEANAALGEAKQVAEQATGAQRRFVAAASHDLVQPLHAARLFIGNALVASRSDAALQGLLEKADMAVDGAHRMLRALLDLSQLETGVLRPRVEPVEAGALIASLAEEFAAQAAARGLALVALPTTRWVATDRDLLRSVLQNLLVNALRYTASGRVVLAVRRGAGGLVRFEVRDSGIGISPDKLADAFGEFSRLPEGRALADGAGLGLSIVSRIAQVLGHPLSVRSVPGQGSVFALSVPETAPVLVRRPAARIGPLDLGGLTVLCIDDEPDVLLGTRALIERWGGAVTALDRAEAVPGDGRWSVALADHHLGGEDGLSLLRRLGARAGLRLLVTASPDEGLAVRAAGEGIVVLAKPIAPLALQSLLEQAARDS
ncbi:PAS-domain containing protein [Novosphingobium flavum]|uniref:histidine kinase n=1 Tax=Novosphingobium flavum TaxID=1778672 RepID=A0A7X1FTS1_9SPHN|nr:ATP-binding protein [Novosphingobium flavum]MBC2666844.1 PAS-domain containing protein [Novosphingobium flavum]